MQNAFLLLERLRDGRVHCRETIAQHLGITHAAVGDCIKCLQAEGVPIQTVAGKGYRLPGGYEFLDRQKIELAFTPATRGAIRTLHLDRITDSTNQRLLDLTTDEDIHAIVSLAEHQTHGRGRRGGSWLAPPGSGLCLSLGWRFAATPSSMSVLSLVVGIALIKMLSQLGATTVALKWPNDIYLGDRKLAGILIEMRAELGGSCTVAIGLGMNIALSRDARARIGEPVADVQTACGFAPSRNRIAAAILNELVVALVDFERVGADPYIAQWQCHDLLAGRRIRLELPGRTVSGIACGVGADGSLRIEQAGRTESFLAGHVIVDVDA